MNLEDSARGLLHEALRVYADHPRASGWLRQQLHRMDEPLRVAVAGAPASGKTTLVAAIGPSRALRDLFFVDTPGDAPPAQVAADADAMLYLMRNRHGRELPLLRSAFDRPIAAATPVTTIAVLSRTDEIGAGRIDALSSGRRLARRYRRHPELRATCLDVVAVAGLIAQAGRTLTEAEFGAMAALAGLPRTELSDALLSADRFVRTELDVEVRPAARQELLDRFGIFGVRLITTLIRTGFDDRTRLSTELVQRSGVTELRESMRQFFVERRGALKARSALLAVDAVLRAEPRSGVVALVSELERVLASAHEFSELRLLSSLRASHGQSGHAPWSEDLDAEAQRLLGGYGTGVFDRLGIEHEPTGAELQNRIMDALDRWQSLAEDPRGTAEARRAARVVVRSCEGMLAALYAGTISR